MKKTDAKTKKVSKKEPKVKKEKKPKKPKEIVEDLTPTSLEVWDESGRKRTYKIDYEGHII